MDYIAPLVVAIGPYYHGLPELQAMEEVKRMAAYHFCKGLAIPPEQVYDKILSIACGVRGCYADGITLQGITDGDFAAMLFFDGCFLVQYWFSLSKKELDNTPLQTAIRSKGTRTIMRDTMLLENQIPWVVLQLLVDLKGVPMVEFFGCILEDFNFSLHTPDVLIDQNFKPQHLLGLVRFYLVGRADHVPEIEKVGCWPKSITDLLSKIRKRCTEEHMPALTTSAAELAEIGVKMTPSATSNFSDMSVTRGPLCATLSLPPLFLVDVTVCSFVNMAAFEQCTRSGGLDELGVSSCLAIVAQLINRQDDVRELCSRSVLHTSYDYHDTLKFFKHLCEHLVVGDSYRKILAQLGQYKRERWMWIAIYRFLYNNPKTIAIVMSTASVVVGIFKAIYSLKQHQP